MSFQDVKLLSLIDQVLADAVHLWSRRPAPSQRLARMDLGKSFVELRKALGDEEMQALFPQAKQAADSIMARLKW